MCTMINKVNNISLRFPQGFKMKRVHPLVKALFPIYSVPLGPLAGRLSLFYSNWTKLTQDPNILNIIQGFEIPFLEKPYQTKLPNPPVLNQKQSNLVREEVKEMLLKGAIQKVTQCKNHYISNLFLISKNDGRNRPVINLKHLNNFIPYQNFKMEGLNLLQSMLQEKDFMCKLDLKDAYFCVPLKKESWKYVRFQWEVTLYEFLSLFRARSSTTDIYKSSKNIYFITKKATDQGNNLFRRHAIDVTNNRGVVNQQGLIFLLTHLGFVINLKKSMLNPVQKIEFLGLEIDSVAMKLSLPQRKVEEIVQMSQNALNNKITLRELTQLIGKLTSTIQAILPAKLQIRFLKQIQIKALRKSLAYQSLITLDLQAKEELS